jgi:hypothetical protein
MEPGLSYLVQYFSEVRGRGELPGPEFARQVKKGVSAEPEQFATFVRSYKAFLGRTNPDIANDHLMVRAVRNIAIVAWFADFDKGGREGLAELGVPPDPRVYYDRPDFYGPSMRAVADFVGMEPGPQASKHIFETIIA